MQIEHHLNILSGFDQVADNICSMSIITIRPVSLDPNIAIPILPIHTQNNVKGSLSKCLKKWS